MFLIFLLFSKFSKVNAHIKTDKFLYIFCTLNDKICSKLSNPTVFQTQFLEEIGGLGRILGPHKKVCQSYSLFKELT